ncbi:MAG: hypothetical protein J6Y94_08380 [Bacteriovoracaceae bacterium]|nr:hypothetical protein [Bacteriovoracaceae bacterium]
MPDGHSKVFFSDEGASMFNLGKKMSKVVVVGGAIGSLIGAPLPLAAGEIGNESICYKSQEIEDLKAYFIDQEKIHRRAYLDRQLTEAERLQAEANVKKIFLEDNWFDLALCALPSGIITKPAGLAVKAVGKVPGVKRGVQKYVILPSLRMGKQLGRKSKQVAQEAATALKKKLAGPKPLPKEDKAIVTEALAKNKEFLADPVQALRSGHLANDPTLTGHLRLHWLYDMSMEEYWEKVAIAKNSYGKFLRSGAVKEMPQLEFNGDLKYAGENIQILLEKEKEILENNLKGIGEEFKQIGQNTNFAQRIADQIKKPAAVEEGNWTHKLLDLEDYVEALGKPGSEVVYKSVSDKLIAETFGRPTLVKILKKEMAGATGVVEDKLFRKTMSVTSAGRYQAYVTNARKNRRLRLKGYLDQNAKNKTALSRREIQKRLIERGDEYTQLERVTALQKQIDNLSSALKNTDPKTAGALYDQLGKKLEEKMGERRDLLASMGELGYVVRERIKLGQEIIPLAAKTKGRKKAMRKNNYGTDMFVPTAMGLVVVGTVIFNTKHSLEQRLQACPAPAEGTGDTTLPNLSPEATALLTLHETDPQELHETLTPDQIMAEDFSTEVETPATYEFAAATPDELVNLYTWRVVDLDQDLWDRLGEIDQSKKDFGLEEKVKSLFIEDEDNPLIGGKKRLAHAENELAKAELAKKMLALVEELYPCPEDGQEVIKNLNDLYQQKYHVNDSARSAVPQKQRAENEDRSISVIEKMEVGQEK